MTPPIRSQGIITRDNVTVGVAVLAYYRMVAAGKSVVLIENVRDAVGPIAQTTLRMVVGRHSLVETLSETDRISGDVRQILDRTTIDGGVEAPWSN